MRDATRRGAARTPAERVAILLFLASILLCGLFLWLKLTRGIAFLGRVPTLAFWLVPQIVGSWIVFRPRCRSSRQVRWLAVLSAFVVVCLVAISIAHTFGGE